MHRDVKIGIAIGILLIALVAIFMWARSDSRTPAPPRGYSGIERALPPAQEPVSPVGIEGGIGLDESPEIGASEVPMPAPPGTGRAGDTTTLQPPAGDTTSVGGRTTSPPVPIPTPPARPEPVASKTYTVKKGDTLIGIAKAQYGDDSKWQLILDANRDKIASPEALPVGMKLAIPPFPTSGAPAPALAPAPAAQRTHTVAPGESLSSIANKYYGAEAKRTLIYEANRARIGNDPDRLQVGLVLAIPPAE